MKMASRLGKLALARARGIYAVFNALNSFSFHILNNYILTLYALSLGANGTFIGSLGAIQFGSFFLMPLGRRIIRSKPILKVFGTAWFLRYLGMAPALLAPLPFAAGDRTMALGLVFIANFAFNAARGIGMIGNNPVLAELGQGKDRGRFFVGISMISSVMSMAASLAAALFLGADASPWRYALFLGIGMALGMVGSLLLFRLPEPRASAGPGTASFASQALKAFRRPDFRYFILVFMGMSFVAAMARPFLTVFFKEVYAQGDAAITLFSTAGGVGALAMGLVTRVLVDRIGAKPLIILFGFFSSLSMLAAAAAPPIGGAAYLMAFLGLLSFASNFGFAGMDNSAQTYFFCLIGKEEMVDYAILYFAGVGAAGALGSIAGGAALDLLQATGMGAAGKWGIYYAALAGLGALLSLAGIGFKRLGAASVKDALGIIFSPRDLRALAVINRLDSSETSDETQRLLKALEESGSAVGAKELASLLDSPRLSVRTGALRAIEAMGAPPPEIHGALLDCLAKSAYSTAGIAARLLGKAGCQKAIPLLRMSLEGDDYMLAGEAMVALARLGDSGSRAFIEGRLLDADNPHIEMMAAWALEILGDPRSLGPLFERLSIMKNPEPYVRDEIIMSAASILGMAESFYGAYCAFLEDHDAALQDLVEGAHEREELAGMLDELRKKPDDVTVAARLLRFIAAQEEAMGGLSRAISPKSVESLLRYPRFRFFLASYASWLVRSR
jgi:MFS family permease